MPAFRADRRCVVVGIAATEIGRASRVADRLRIPQPYGDWRELVASPDIDLISIAVPPAIQPDVVTAAAAAGKPVLCEKPIAVDVTSARPMVEAARAAGIASAVDFEFAELPAWRELRQLISAGAIGPPRSYAVRWCVRTRLRPPNAWKDRTEAGGGAVGGFLSHLLYLIEWCFGRIVRVRAALGPGSGRSTADVELELTDGAPCVLSIVTTAPQPSGLRVEVTGSGRRAVLQSSVDDYVRGQSLTITDLSAGRTAIPLAELPTDDHDPRVAAVAPLVRRFIDAITSDGVRMRPDLDDGLRVQSLLDTVVAAGRDGGWAPA